MDSKARLEYMRLRMKKPFALNKAVIAKTKQFQAELEEEEEEAGDGDDCPALDPVDDSAPVIRRKQRLQTEDESHKNESVLSPTMRAFEEPEAEVPREKVIVRRVKKKSV